MILTLPSTFSFKGKDTLEFAEVLSWFRWEIPDREVIIDFRTCMNANYQTLALLVLYAWKLKSLGKIISFQLAPRSQNPRQSTPSDMWGSMGARGWLEVLNNKENQFRGSPHKPLFAVRGRKDTSLALARAERFAKGFNVEYEKTLQYVLSELLYNTMEHGQSWFDQQRKQIPSLIQFTWYEKRNEISFMIADLGIGVKRHLEQAYPAFEDDKAALEAAIQPQISGTFGAQSIYSGKNNAGVGLYLSRSIVQKLHSDMYLVSGQAALHVSARDITVRAIEHGWPGTFVLFTLKLFNKKLPLDLQGMLSQARDAAVKEVAAREGKELAQRLTLSMENFFGRYAEDKTTAIAIRDKKLLPSLEEGKDVLIDFAHVVSSPHSFLSALLATPIKILGMSAYKRIRITNATADIRETIDYILDENTTP